MPNRKNLYFDVLEKEVEYGILLENTDETLAKCRRLVVYENGDIEIQYFTDQDWVKSIYDPTFKYD